MGSSSLNLTAEEPRTFWAPRGAVTPSQFTFPTRGSSTRGEQASWNNNPSSTPPKEDTGPAPDPRLRVPRGGPQSSRQLLLKQFGEKTERLGALLGE